MASVNVWLATSSALLILLSSLTSTLAQNVATSIVVLPASTVMVATTLTSYSPDVTTTVTPTTPASPQYTSLPDMKVAVLNSTNFFRWEHNATFLAWNDSLANYASNYAPQCLWAHSHGGPGENLARGYPTVSGSVDAWGNERSMYNFQTPTGFTEATGHFTQLVWKSTVSVGCAAVNCGGKNGVEGWYLVCEYWPPGNVVGQGSNTNSWFKANVQSQVNNGQGFNYASATAGVSGVGTSWASSAGLPAATQGSNAVGLKNNLGTEVIGAFVALIGVVGW